MAKTDTGIKRVFRAISDYFYKLSDKFNIGNSENRYLRNIANRFMKALKTADVQKAEKAPARYKLSQNQVVITDEITVEDVKKIQNIANSHPKGYSINEFSSEEIKICEKFAKKFWRELGIKSPFFRAWFGDWRVNDKTSIESITLKSDNSFISETVKNKDTGFEISVSKIAKDHIKIHFHNSEFSQYIINNLNEITEKSIFLDTCVSEPTGNTKHKNTMVVHNFYVPTEFNGEKIIVKLFVEEFYNNYNGQIQRRDYDLSKVEVFNDTDRFGGSNPTPLYASKNTSMLTISDLFQFVKLYDKNFNPKPASKVVNEDGIPMVMYHGTDYKFTEFDISKGRANMDIQGAFFSPWELDAKGYGKNVGKYYLNIKKPADGPTAFKALNIFKGHENENPRRVVKEFLKKHINEISTVIESGQKVYFGKDLPGEYIYSKSSLNIPRKKKNMKWQVSQNLNEIIEIASNRRWEKPNNVDKHKRDAKYGFYKYTSYFMFDGIDFEVDVLIRNSENGKKYLYDIQNIKEVASHRGNMPSLQTVNGSVRPENNLNNIIIHQDEKCQEK